MSASDQPQELIDVPGSRVDLREFSGVPAAIHNFVGSPTEQWAMTAYATGPSCKEGRDQIGKTIAVKHWYLHEVDVRRDDGSSVHCVRTVLIDPEGTCFGFVSDGIYQSLRLMVQHLGNGPYDPPILVAIRQQGLRGGRSMLSFEPVPQRTSDTSSQRKGK